MASSKEQSIYSNKKSSVNGRTYIASALYMQLGEKYSQIYNKEKSHYYTLGKDTPPFSIFLISFYFILSNW